MFTSFELLGQNKCPIVQSNCTNKKSTQLEVIVEDLRERKNRGNKVAYIGLRCGVISTTLNHQLASLNHHSTTLNHRL